LIDWYNIIELHHYSNGESNIHQFLSIINFFIQLNPEVIYPRPLTFIQYYQAMQ
jgi:hypothetical protein